MFDYVLQFSINEFPGMKTALSLSDDGKEY